MAIEHNSIHAYALRLHALGESDRNWILAGLDPDVRERLTTLLEELQTMGWQADEDLSGVVVSAGEERAEALSPDEAVLDRADPAWVAAQLANEPRAVLDCLMRVRSWRWATAFHVDPFPRAPGSWRCSDEVSRALVSMLAKRFESDPSARVAALMDSVQSPRPVRRSGYRKWFPWLA